MNPLHDARGGRSWPRWAVADLVLLPRRRALGLEVPKPLGFALRVAALVLFLANWVYLIAAGR